jgi:mycoredoxin
MSHEIQVYGTDWCGLTFSVRKFLLDARLTHRFYDIDRDHEAERFVVGVHNGQRRFPVVVIHERVVTHPTRAQLQRVLEEQGLCLNAAR